MRRRVGRVSNWLLAVLCVVALFFSFLEGRSVRSRRGRDYDLKLASARLSQRAFALLRDERDRLNIPIDSVNDPNQTGLVGLIFSATTYGRSDISDALTTTNPDFSAVLVELLKGVGVRSGDTVGVSWDGTFPALNVQLLAVASVMGFEPLIVTAQSGASWGANYPGFFWLDQERILRRAGFFRYRSKFATLGGADDAGEGLSQEGRAQLAAAAESAGVELRVPAGLQQGIRERLALFQRCRAVVIIGKAAVDRAGMTRVPASRVYRGQSRTLSGDCLIAELLRRRTPVVYIGNPSQVAADYRLPVAPEPLPEPGRSRLYVERRYSVPLAAALVIVLGFLLWLVVRYDVEACFGLRRGSSADEEAV